MHYLRPFFAFLIIASLILLVRWIMVPADFGIQETGYMYGWYRKSNEKEWQAREIKYQGKEYCQSCHAQPYQDVSSSPHRLIECENCHGPALTHPTEPPKLAKNANRELCLRCHTYLPYPTSKRSEIKGIDQNEHNPGLACISCHEPHKASKPG
ncbi:MAG: cytochrome c3 family protein [Thermodesulfobacteriota bacterium]